MSEYAEDIANYIFRHLARLRFWNAEASQNAANIYLFGGGGGGSGGGGGAASTAAAATGKASETSNAAPAAAVAWVPESVKPAVLAPYAPLEDDRRSSRSSGGRSSSTLGLALAVSREREKAHGRVKTANSMVEGRIKAMVRGMLNKKSDSKVAKLVHQFADDFQVPSMGDRTDQAKSEALRCVRHFMTNVSLLVMEHHGREIGALLASLDSPGLDNRDVLRTVQLTCEAHVYPRVEAKVLQCVSQAASDDEVLKDRLCVLAKQPQAFFGVPPHLQSANHYAAAVAKLKFMESASLPTAKLDALGEAATAIRAEVANLRVAALRQRAQWAKPSAGLAAKAASSSGAGTPGLPQSPPSSSLPPPPPLWQSHNSEGEQNGQEPPDWSVAFGKALSAEHFLAILSFVVCQANLKQPLVIKSLLWSLAEPSAFHGDLGWCASMLELALVFVAGPVVPMLEETVTLPSRSFEPDELMEIRTTAVSALDTLAMMPSHTATTPAGGDSSSNGSTFHVTPGRGRTPNAALTKSQHHRMTIVQVDEEAAKASLQAALTTNVAVVMVKPKLLLEAAMAFAASADGGAGTTTAESTAPTARKNSSSFFSGRSNAANAAVPPVAASGASVESIALGAAVKASELCVALIKQHFSEQSYELTVAREGVLEWRDAELRGVLAWGGPKYVANYDPTSTSYAATPGKTSSSGSSSSSSTSSPLSSAVAAAVRTVGLPYLVVQFPEVNLPWVQFNDLVIGHPDPQKAREGSLSKRLMLGDLSRRLVKAPLRSATSAASTSTGAATSTSSSSSSWAAATCGVHASAGPLASLMERTKWLRDSSELLEPQWHVFRTQAVDRVIRRWLRGSRVAAGAHAASPWVAISRYRPLVGVPKLPPTAISPASAVAAAVAAAAASPLSANPIAAQFAPPGLLAPSHASLVALYAGTICAAAAGGNGDGPGYSRRKSSRLGRKDAAANSLFLRSEGATNVLKVNEKEKYRKSKSKLLSLRCSIPHSLAHYDGGPIIPICPYFRRWTRCRSTCRARW